MRRAAVFTVAALMSCAGAKPAPISGRIAKDILLIGIARQAVSVTLQAQGDFSVIGQTTGDAYMLIRGRSYAIEADKTRRLMFGPFIFPGPARLLPGKPSDYVRIGGKTYRGNLIFKPNANGTVTVVAEVGIEEYLYGVLPKEMSPDWPLEALKAQAVVARTFALANLGKFAGEGYDLSDDSRSQLYSGLGPESLLINRAVTETTGQVLRWRGALLAAHYHSCCGGSTADPATIWATTGPTPRPLRGVRDRYCKMSPYYRWSAYFSAQDILAALQRHGCNGARLKSLRPGRRLASGYVKELRFHLDTGAVAVRANEFRAWMGSSGLRSTQIWRVIQRKKGYEFVGRGYGHGVGLCQWGARAQAQQGRSYKKILRFYFPGADIATYEL